MTEVSQFITNLGFPIFVAVWMLYKSSKDSERMNDTINDLKNAIILLTSEIKHHDVNGGSKDE
jgi:hypothetical protein